MLLRVALDVQFVNDGVVPRERLVIARSRPVEARIDDRAFRHERRAVPLVERQIVPRFHLIAEERGIPGKLADMRARIRIEQQLVRIEAMSRLRLVRAVTR